MLVPFLRRAGALGAIMLALVVPRMAGAQSANPALAIPKDLKPYFLALYKAGPRHGKIAKAEADTLLVGHLNHLRRMTEDRKFVTYGPATDNGDVIGMIIVSAANLTEARRLVDEDPHVKAGEAVIELHPVMLPSLAGVAVRY